jgi:tetratricopeptide (TPR) repeat protein
MGQPLVLFGVLVLLALSYSPALVSAQDRGPGASASQQSQNDSSNAERETEMSSSKDTRIDLSPPRNDTKDHPNSSVSLNDGDDTPSDVGEMHPWDPHRAAKDIEVGDYYFKIKDYRGAMWRYQDALLYKPNDAVANFRLAQCEEKINKPSDAIQHYETYLKILPEGPFASDAKKALERLKPTAKK